MNINECGCRPYGWFGLDGDRCIRVIPRQKLKLPQVRGMRKLVFTLQKYQNKKGRHEQDSSKLELVYKNVLCLQIRRINWYLLVYNFWQQINGFKFIFGIIIHTAWIIITRKLPFKKSILNKSSKGVQFQFGYKNLLP